MGIDALLIREYNKSKNEKGADIDIKKYAGLGKYAHQKRKCGGTVS